MTDKLKKLIEDELKTAYDQGVSEGKRVNEKRCEGCRYVPRDYSHYPCNVCRNNYCNLWDPEKKDSEIEFGDEVIDEDGEKGIVVSKNNAHRKELYVLFNEDDVPQIVSKGKHKKTGKHYVLEKFMEGLKR